ncbi:recombinase family protein [Pseudomonas sp. GV047]|uniref:recombinase family protein n=1 Tax=Pseudomonas sp. GV047 TaxID=2135751 RepID=UPI002113EA21|nr:recombinase family protein [Pseudomonas sp. GV047]
MKAPATRRPYAISYVRFSSMRQTGGTSVERQEAMIASWLEGHPDYDLYTTEFKDLAKSGFKGEHVEKGGGFGKLLEAIHRGAIQAGDVVLVEALDRTGRLDATDMLGILHPIISAGVAIITLDDNQTYDRSALNGAGLFMLSAKIQSAHQYSDTLSRRVGASYESRRKAAKAGVVPKRWTPLWLTTEGEVIVSIAAQVKLAYELYVSGLGKTAIAKRLRESGVPELAKCSGPTVDGWLKNRCTVGDWEAHKDNPDRETEVIAGVYPPIITLALYQKAQLHRERVGTAKPVQHSKHFLVGLVKCAECGKNYIYQNVNGKPHNMKCRVHTNDKQCPNFACIPKPVMDAVLAWTGDKAKLAGIATLHSSVNEVEIAALRAEIDTVTFKVKGLMDTIKAVGAIPEFLEDLKVLTLERDEHQARLTLLERTEKPVAGNHWQYQAEMWWLEENDPERLSALMQQIGYTITIHQDKRIQVGQAVFKYDGYLKGSKEYKVIQAYGSTEERLVMVRKNDYCETGLCRRVEGDVYETA